MPTLTLTIVPTGEPHGTMTSYRVHDAAGRLVFATRAYSTPEGTQGARERIRAWMRRDGYRVVLRTEEHTARKVA